MTAPGGVAVTTTLTRQESEEVARRVLGMTSGAQAQVQVGSSTSASLQFARGDTHMATENVGVSVRFEVEMGDRHASGTTNQLDDASLQALVTEVEALAREKRTPGKWTDKDIPPILPPQEYAEGAQIFFPVNVDAMQGEAQAEIFRRATEAAEAKGLISAGDLSLSASTRSVLNSKGLWAYERSSYGEFSLTARTKDGRGSGWGWSGYEDWGRVNVDGVIRRAVSLAAQSANPVAVEPGRYTVILEPTAVAELIHPIIQISTRFWSAQWADAGGTVFSKEPLGTNKIGLQMMDRRLGMISDPWDPERPASPISGDWRPLVPVPWFQEGILRHLAHDPRYAQAKKTEPVYNPGGARLTAQGPTQTLEEMIASTKRGVWVHRLSHVVPMHLRTLLLTGTTRDGMFLIEDGKVSKAIKNFRFTESPFFVFNQLEAWGEPVRASSQVVAPRLKLRDFNFTSLTDAV